MFTSAVSPAACRPQVAANASVKMGSAAPILTTAANTASELAANASKYAVGGGYWERMAAMVVSHVPASIGGSIAGAMTGFGTLLVTGSEIAGSLVGGLTGIGTLLGLYPVTFKHFGSNFLRAVPK
jgi:hypothetical protein